MKQLITLFLILCVACSGVQSNTSTLPRTTNQPTPDAASAVPVDAFVVELPPLPEPQALQMPLTDAGTGPNGELIAPLRADARAPFNGVLFNGPALAFVEVEYRAVQQRCMIDRRRETQEVAARYQAQLERLQVSLESVQTQNRIIVQGRDREIESLNRIVTEQQRNSSGETLRTALWFGGGLLIGSIIVGTTAYLVTR